MVYSNSKMIIKKQILMNCYNTHIFSYVPMFGEVKSNPRSAGWFSEVWKSVRKLLDKNVFSFITFRITHQSWYHPSIIIITHHSWYHSSIMISHIIHDITHRFMISHHSWNHLSIMISTILKIIHHSRDHYSWMRSSITPELALHSRPLLKSLQRKTRNHIGKDHIIENQHKSRIQLHS